MTVMYLQIQWPRTSWSFVSWFLCARSSCAVIMKPNALFLSHCLSIFFKSVATWRFTFHWHWSYEGTASPVGKCRCGNYQIMHREISVTGKRDDVGGWADRGEFSKCSSSNSTFFFCYCMQYFENRIQKKIRDQYERMWQGDQKLCITVLGALW